MEFAQVWCMVKYSSILIEIDIPPESHRKRLEIRGGNEIRLNQLVKPEYDQRLGKFLSRGRYVFQQIGRKTHQMLCQCSWRLLFPPKFLI